MMKRQRPCTSEPAASVRSHLRYGATRSVYGVFGVVIGLLAWLSLGGQALLIAAELNVVRARRLWPRSLLQPPLTEAHRRTMVDLAR